jgi:glucokinase
MKLAGIEIGGTKLQVVLGNENGSIQKRISHIIDSKEGAVMIRSLIEQDLRKFGPIDGIGVGFGGPVNRVTGEIWTSYHVEGWTGFNIKQWLTDFTGSQVAIENDANVAALGESVIGAGIDHNIVFYVTLGSGVGGGLTIDRQIYHGQLPGEVEFGHVRLTPSGNTVQDSCSGWAVNEKILRAADLEPNSALALLAKKYPGAEAKALVEAIDAGDAEALEIFESTITDLAFGLSHVVHLFHPDTIIIGGGLSLIGQRLRRKVEEKLRTFIIDAFQPGPLVQLSKLGSDVVPVGALILAAQHLKSK